MFEKQVSYSEVQIAVNINPFVAVRQLIESNSKRDINQDISYSPVKSEKVPVVAVVFMMVMNEYIWPVNKSFNYVAINRMMEIVFMIPV